MQCFRPLPAAALILPPSPSAQLVRFRSCHTSGRPAAPLQPPQVGYIFHCAFLMRQEKPAEECKVGSCGHHLGGQQGHWRAGQCPLGAMSVGWAAWLRRL